MAWFTIWHYKCQIVSFLDIVHCTALGGAPFDLKRVVLEFEDVLGSATLSLGGTRVVVGSESGSDIGYHYATSMYILITYIYMK